MASTAHAADPHCVAIGGMGLANAMDETHMVAALSGDMTGAHAKITGKREIQNGLVLNMEHHFINDRNGFIKTSDIATLTKVKGGGENYMITILYEVSEAGGTYEGYSGEFSSFGLIKLDEGKVVLRYQGELCR